MKNKSFTILLLAFLLSCLSGCEPDYEIILMHSFEDFIIEDKVSRIIVIPDKSYVEVYMKADAGGAKYLIKNQQKDYFIDQYQRLLEEENISNAPGLEFDTRTTTSDFVEAYGLLLIYIAFAIIMLIITSRQRATIQELRERINELEDELKYTK